MFGMSRISTLVFGLTLQAETPPARCTLQTVSNTQLDASVSAHDDDDIYVKCGCSLANMLKAANLKVSMLFGFIYN